MSNIRIDYLHGIRQAVQHLAALRHERIGFIAGPLSLKSAVARRDAFRQSMNEIGMTVHPELVVEGDHSLEGGVRAFSRMLTLAARPTAVLCSNDMTAMGVMRKCYTEGIIIPRDLSVIGFDNVRITQFMLPPLSIIEMSQAEIARIAFRALLEDVQRSAPNPKGTEYVLQTNLILRESTALSSKWAGSRQREVG